MTLCAGSPTNKKAGNQEIIVFHYIIMFGISPMTTELCVARGALFPRERPVICTFSSRSVENVCATSKHKHTLAKYHGGARHMPATVRFLAFFRAAQARYRLAH